VALDKLKQGVYTKRRIIPRRTYMASNNKMKSTKNNKREDGKFHSKHIKHDPQAESARAVFGLKEDNSKEKHL